MSDDDVFVITTSFGDVAELGQGYVNRADGERLLLPLPGALTLGDGVRFIVHLADGTPAFAGAGRCVQVSDQGGAVDEAERFETLLDSLAFDERSQPVYDYVVAVRQAVYAAGGPGADATEEAVAEDAVAHDDEVIEASQDAADAELDADASEADEDAEPTQFLAALDAEPVGQDVVELAAASMEVADEAGGAHEASLAQETHHESHEAGGASFEDEGSDDSEYVEPASFVVTDAPPSAAPPARSEAPAAVAIGYAPPVSEAPPEAEFGTGAFVFEPLPTGMLQRPAVAAHWQPLPPRLPQPSPRSGLFRYPSGPLPVPAAPPRPAIDARLRVSRAPAPPPQA